LDFEDGYRIRTSANLIGECLGFRNVMPTYHLIQSVFDTKEFNAALKSIKGLSSTYLSIDLTLKETSLGTVSTISCADKDFSTEITEVVDNQTTYSEPNTGEFSIRFNQSNLALATNSVESRNFDMFLVDRDRAALIKEEGFTYLVMPMMRM